MKKAVIFDLDGTLLDTAQDIGLAMNTALGTSFTPDQIKNFVGNGLKNAVKAALLSMGKGLEDLDTLTEELKKHYRRIPVLHTHPYPGITDMLKTLNKNGVVCGVFSNKDQDLAETVIRTCFPDVDIPFISGRNGKYNSKPDPQAVFEFCKFAGCSINDLLYVGDSEVDYACSKNANADVVIFTWGSRTPDRLLSLGVPESVMADSADIVLKIVLKNG